MELMATLTIVGVLAALSAPSISSIIKNQRVTSQTNEFVADVTFARNEVRTRGITPAPANGGVVICPAVAAGGACAPIGTSNYTNGRLIFVDVNGNGDFDPGEQILRERPKLEGATNTLNAFDTLGSGAAIPGPIMFGADGVVQKGAANYAICDDRGPGQGRQVVIGASGQSRVLRSGDLPLGSYVSGCP